ncbi:MAG: WXG100 family type VII secretion target [Coriobacteriia bacterium]|nr:WXG100 family type VII secretion target [Coriobacteriia bacterium]
MSSEVINIQPGQVRSHADAIKNSNTQLTEIMNEVTRSVSGLLGVSWEGTPIEGMNAKLSALKNKIQTEQQVIQEYETFLRRTADRWEAVDQGVAGNVQQVLE